MTRWPLLVAALALGCSKSAPADPAPSAPPRTTPRVSASSRLPIGERPGGRAQGRMTRADAIAKGKELHAGTTAGCGDARCKIDRCKPACVTWLSGLPKEAYGSSGSSADAELWCTGYCVDPSPDGG